MRRCGRRALGPADWVTLSRTLLVGCVTALTADSFTREPSTTLLVSIAVVALVLDFVDGRVARRTHTTSEFGARFDMEVDAFLLLVLGGYVMHSEGVWVLAIGAMRYAYVAASWMSPWMRARLPVRATGARWWPPSRASCSWSRRRRCCPARGRPSSWPERSPCCASRSAATWSGSGAVRPVSAARIGYRRLRARTFFADAPRGER